MYVTYIYFNEYGVSISFRRPWLVPCVKNVTSLVGGVVVG